MATVHVELVWNWQDFKRLSVPVCLRIFILVTQGQVMFGTSLLWACGEIWKCFPFRINWPKTLNYFRIITNHPIRDNPGVTDDLEGHLRSHEATIRLSPIICDRMEIETHKWCQRTWLVKPLWKICMLTYMDHDLTWHEGRFRNWPFKVKTHILQTGSSRRTQWCHFHISHIKEVINKKCSLYKTIIFIWWPLEPKLLTLGQIWSKNVTRPWRKLYRFFLNYS